MCLLVFAFYLQDVLLMLLPLCTRLYQLLEALIHSYKFPFSSDFVSDNINFILRKILHKHETKLQAKLIISLVLSSAYFSCIYSLLLCMSFLWVVFPSASTRASTSVQRWFRSGLKQEAVTFFSADKISVNQQLVPVLPRLIP